MMDYRIMDELSNPQWYCIHTKPKSEHMAAAALKQFDDVVAYCPRIRFQRSTARGKVWFVEALFPSYFFARFDLTTRFRAVKHAHHVIGIVGFGGVPVPLSQATIDDLKEEMAGEELREIRHGLNVGDTVEVAEGPMRGLRGVVEGFASGEERVKVLLEFLGRQSLVEVPASRVLSERGPRQGFSDKTTP